MKPGPQENAENFGKSAATTLKRCSAFQRLSAAAQAAILRDLGTIQDGFNSTAGGSSPPDPYAFSLETPEDFARRRSQAGRLGPGPPSDTQATPAPATDGGTPGPRVAATETLARRAGALSDEVNFPAFVAGLVHGTFDAMVDASIRQMEAFADLVSAVAKDVDRFTDDNVSPNQARDWLAHQYPKDITLEMPATPDAGEPKIHPRHVETDSEEAPSPQWLADYGLKGEPLTDELIEEHLIPAARRRVGENRLQMLATMVLLGMNRINIKDGSISARLRFRAAASDKAKVDYAVSQDPGDPTWGQRGSSTYAEHSTMVSTVGVNVQAESELKTELFGEVKINFVSETLPLERFVDSARMNLLQRNARPGHGSIHPEPAASAEQSSVVLPVTGPASSVAPLPAIPGK